MHYLVKNESLIDQSQNKSDLELVFESGMIIFDSWPPIGKKFENGNWRDKTLSEKTEDGEINLEDRRNLLKSGILNFLSTKLEQGVQFQGFNFQSREEDLIRMSLAIKKIELGGSWSGFWRDSINQWRELTSEQLNELALTAGNFWETCFRKSRTLIDELPSKNKTQLANYNIDLEWNGIE
ncbi:hypothetical protein ND856_14235 [Leptospira bandrabouensis]|uniref:DUF4376 domain-containing protein n=1 Tax=Leptospira bandrabouensis TaxID=2484903 RepID=UPI00223D5052|nr:hypothetical protein [Leptospira bandrabouensis]MCW7459532.1 hypothetical protein [Leptospira bandrabouensis]MCW7478450.1 hypothetical protein [Leptospira bandrabouensis]MCW7486266.1 hypothetical protein [Leptospira bandrabouensis]